LRRTILPGVTATFLPTTKPLVSSIDSPFETRAQIFDKIPITFDEVPAALLCRRPYHFLDWSTEIRWRKEPRAIPPPRACASALKVARQTI
jgi:hypothetical protein